MNSFDQYGREQDRHRQRNGDRDEDESSWALIPGLHQRVGQLAEADRVRCLDQHHIAGAEFGTQQLDGGIGVGDQLWIPNPTIPP